MRLLKLPTLMSIVFLSILLVGCRTSTVVPNVTPVVPTQPATTMTAAPSKVAPSPTPVQPRSLVLCVTSEPQSLYIYGSSSNSMWSVLQAVYDGPFDTRGYSVQPVILQKIPSLADGDAVLKPKVVKSGDLVVDASGNLVTLHTGTKVSPAGCTSADCAAPWDGKSELSLDQLSVTFKLKPGLKWSDGTPLTAADSVFSYGLAADPASPTSKYLSDRTVSYKAADDQTVVWTGLPGFYEQRYGTFFWSPLPKHTEGSLSAKQLLTDTTANRSPLGWGPYTIQEWTPGDHITLRKNPNYFRAAEGLPKFDTLVYRFVGNAPDGDMNALLSGECDAVDQNDQFMAMFPDLVQRQTDKKLKILVGQGPEWEHLDFGITPASYEGGKPAADRPDYFGDVRTRQAFAYCIDRAKVASTLLYGRSEVPNSYLPTSHPFYQKDLPKYDYNPNEGMKLLDEVGWKDTDNNPDTPRVSSGVKNVPDGTPFKITYLTTQAKLRQEVSSVVAGSLKSCGVQADVKPTNPGTVFAPGPDGPVFGRKFDLAQFSWEAGSRPNCTLYTSSQIPSAGNQWIGSNVSGYSSPEFDAACTAAYNSRQGEKETVALNRQAQALYARDLPAIPLYSSLKIAIARTDLCGLNMDVTAPSIFWNVEALDYGKGCQ